MADPVSAPSDYGTLRLDTRHETNFRLMLRSLRVTAGLNTLGGAQSTFNAAPGGGQQVDRTLGGLEAEAKPFEPMAYGATLGLIYYRALGTVARSLWDAAMERQLSESMASHASALQAQRNLAMQINTNPKLAQQPDWRANRQNNAQTIQNFARYADFLATLREKKRAVFPNSTDAALNDPKVIGQNPWCLGTRPEFTSAYKQVKGAPANPHPAFYSGRPEAEKSLSQNAAKMFGVAVEAKTVEYLGAFLEKGSAALLRGSLREGMDYVCKIPIVDLLVDWLKDKRQEEQLRSLQRLYDDEMERRRLIYSYGWAVSPEPELDQVTPADTKAYGAQR